jgi:P27 family predicted phage terminase small subunit
MDNKIILDTSKVRPETRNFIFSVLEYLNGKLVAGVDDAAMHLLMITYEECMQAMDCITLQGAVIKDRKGRLQQNPADRVMRSSFDRLFAIMKSYGLTLKSREDIRALTSSVSKDNPLAVFLAKAND